MPQLKPCTDLTPSWFVGHWLDWHRGHGCDKDDGKPRSAAAATEIDQHAANGADDLAAIMSAITTNNDLLVRRLDKLATLGSLPSNLVAAVRGLIEAAIPRTALAQCELERIADEEVPSDPEVLRTVRRELKIAQQLFATATETLRVAIEDPRPTSPGGIA